MELKDFVSETLKQIIQGVSEAQTFAKTHEAKVNPSLLVNNTNTNSMGILRTLDNQAVSNIEFDVAVTATESTGTKGGLAIASGLINLGSSGRSDNENISVSKIKFNVPLLLPNPE